MASRNRIEHLFGRETRRDPAHDPFKSLLAAFLDDVFGHTHTALPQTPRWNVKESEDTYEVTLGIPGFCKKDVKVAVEQNALVVRAACSSEEGAGEFQSALALPEGIDVDLIQAEMKDGLLKVTIPKPEGHKPKEIEIKDVE